MSSFIYTLMGTIGERLRAERKRIGLNQTQLAEFGGVQITAQANYEKNIRMPDAGYLAGVAKVGIDLLYVLTGTPSVKDLKPDEIALVDNYRHSSEEGQKAITATSALLSQQGATKPGAAKKGKVA